MLRGFLYIGQKSLCQKLSHKYSNQLPKGSRFSSEFGLNEQLKNTQKKAQNYQSSSVTAYSVVIVGCISFFGFLLTTFFLKEEKRSNISLYKNMLKHQYSKEQKSQQFLKEIKEHYKKYSFSSEESLLADSVMDYVINRMFQKSVLLYNPEITEIMNQKVRKYKIEKQVTPKAITHVRRYLEIQIKNEIYAQDINETIKFCFKFGDPSLIFLALRSIQQGKVLNKLNKKIKEGLKRRLQQTQEKIKKTQTQIGKEVEKNHNFEGIRYCLGKEKQFIKYIRNLIFK